MRLLLLVFAVICIGVIESSTFVFRTSTAAASLISFSTNASLWTDKQAWYSPNGTMLLTLPGPADDVYINDLSLSGCSTGIVYLNVSTTIRSLTIGTTYCRLTDACAFALVLDSKLKVITNVTVSMASELRLGPTALLNATYVFIASNASVGGSGHIMARTTYVNGGINPYNEGGLRVASGFTPALSFATMTFSGSLNIRTGGVLVDLLDDGSDQVVINGALLLSNQSYLWVNTLSTYVLSSTMIVVDPAMVNGSFSSIVPSTNPDPWPTHNVEANCGGTYIDVLSQTNPNNNCPTSFSKKRCVDVNQPSQPSSTPVICNSGGGGFTIVVSPSQACPPTSCAPGYSGTNCATFSCTGNSTDCSGGGKCVGTYPSPPKCSCYQYYNGSSCQFPYCPGSGNCNNKGSCIATTDGTAPSCKCNTNWAGVDCSIPLCPNSCSGHGTCVASDSPVCSCNVGYTTKPDCSVQYLACPGTPACGGTSHGICNNATGVCACKYGWDGTSDCSIANCHQDCGLGVCKTLGNGTNACTCPSLSAWNYYCAAPTSAPTTPPPTTSVQPTGTATTKTGTTTRPTVATTTSRPITSKPPTGTPASTVVPPSTSAPSTIRRFNGTIINGSIEETLDSTELENVTTTSVPTTSAPTTPEAATTELATTIAATTPGPTAGRPPLECGHGSPNASSYRCDCFPGWTGSQCNVIAADACPNNCSQSGECAALNGVPQCICSAFHSGADCSRVNHPCSSACVRGQCNTTTGECACESDFMGSACDIPVCSGCSHGGSCNASAKCECFQGWEGENCTVAIPYCPNNCSFNGPCALEQTENRVVCLCVAPWTGDDCSQSLLKPGSTQTRPKTSLVTSPVLWAPVVAGVVVVVVVALLGFKYSSQIKSFYYQLRE